MIALLVLLAACEPTTDTDQRHRETVGESADTSGEVASTFAMIDVYRLAAGEQIILYVDGGQFQVLEYDSEYRLWLDRTPFWMPAHDWHLTRSGYETEGLEVAVEVETVITVVHQ